MIKIAITSDFHGRLPEIPPCDLLLIGGDIAPTFDLGHHEAQVQWGWLQGQFRPWLEQQPCNHCIVTPGNHDWWGYLSHCVEGWPGFEVLVDSTTNFRGMQIHGCPWSRTFRNWAFMKDKLPLAVVHDCIPDCDILLSHGPAYGYGDFVPFDELGRGGNQGAQSLLNNILRIQPKLVITGHIHEDGGIWNIGKTTIINNSLVDGKYKTIRQPLIMEIS